MSHRRLFDGWEPAEVTTYVYDGDRLVRSVTVREPEFDREQVALLVAASRVVRNRFGIPVDEAMNPDNQFKYRGADKPSIDWAEKAVEDKKDAYYKALPDVNRNGHRWGLKPVED